MKGECKYAHDGVRYRQIGNAVSPLMARVLGNGLKKVLERIEQP